MKKNNLFAYLILLSTLALTSCGGRKQDESSLLHTVQIIDRNGFNETISQRERLKQFEKVDFLAPQPYRKAVRVYPRNSEGQIPALITSYHDNGQIWQYLETNSGRARGGYFEWYPNGELHIQANVIEGVADLTGDAQETWVFDGENYVYDETGVLVARIAYKKGEQSGEATYFYRTGQIERIVPYTKDKIHGIVAHYNVEGELIGETYYDNDVPHGKSYCLGRKEQPAFEEVYDRGLLVEGVYYDFNGKCLGRVENGNGEKAHFEEGVLLSITEFRDGVPEGSVKTFTKEGTLESQFMIKEGMKHGEEIVYFIPKRKTLNQVPQPKLAIDWVNDEIHGMVKTWYTSGTLESQREMANNRKHGMSFAWYSDGSLMLVEEYEEDKLRKGSYMKRGQALPVSKVENGHGIATLYDGDGAFLKRVKYENGRPHDS